MSTAQIDVMTVTQVIRSGPFGRQKIYQLLNSGALPATKLGRNTLVRVSDFEKLIATAPRYPAKDAKSNRREGA